MNGKIQVQRLPTFRSRNKKFEKALLFRNNVKDLEIVPYLRFRFNEAIWQQGHLKLSQQG